MEADKKIKDNPDYKDKLRNRKTIKIKPIGDQPFKLMLDQTKKENKIKLKKQQKKAKESEITQLIKDDDDGNEDVDPEALSKKPIKKIKYEQSKVLTEPIKKTKSKKNIKFPSKDNQQKDSKEKKQKIEEIEEQIQTAEIQKEDEEENKQIEEQNQVVEKNLEVDNQKQTEKQNQTVEMDFLLEAVQKHYQAQEDDQEEEDQEEEDQEEGEEEGDDQNEGDDYQDDDYQDDDEEDNDDEKEDEEDVEEDDEEDDECDDEEYLQSDLTKISGYTKYWDKKQEKIKKVQKQIQEDKFTFKQQLWEHQKYAYLLSEIVKEKKMLIKMYCGTGKSRVIFEKILQSSIDDGINIVVMPSLMLIEQFLTNYEQIILKIKFLYYLLVFKTLGKLRLLLLFILLSQQ